MTEVTKSYQAYQLETPRLGADFAVTLFADHSVSASDGQGVALPLLAPGMLATGVDSEQLDQVYIHSIGRFGFACPYRIRLVDDLRQLWRDGQGGARYDCSNDRAGAVLRPNPCLVMFHIGL